MPMHLRVAIVAYLRGGGYVLHISGVGGESLPLERGEQERGSGGGRPQNIHVGECPSRATNA